MSLRPSHGLGAGLLLGLSVSGRPWLIFGAGVLAGVLALLAARALRRALRFGGRLGRLVERHAAGEEPSSDETGAHRSPGLEGLAGGGLTAQERERERARGRRQGEAAGIRAAARLEVRESARRQAMDEALEDHWRRSRGRSLEHALEGGKRPLG